MGMTIQETARAIPHDTFGLRLKIARHFAGDISIEKAATLCDLKPATWSAWEREVNPPKHLPAVAALIARRLEVDEEWLVKGGPLQAPDPTRGGEVDQRPVTPNGPRESRYTTTPVSPVGVVRIARSSPVRTIRRAA